MEKLAKAAIGEHDPGKQQFAEIHRAEIESINKRRGRNNRSKVRPISVKGGAPVYDTIGLSLSGGGIRSAAFSLGVLQALNHQGVLKNVDYLSTVSGGGYIGSSLSATMSESGGEFVFEQGEQDQSDIAQMLASEISDTEAVGHIRNYSNYLIPRGFRDVLTGVAIVLRGLVANLGFVLPIVLLLAAITVWSNPDRSSLTCTDFFGYPLCKYLPIESFGLTLLFALSGLVLFFLWALYRCFLPPHRLAEFQGDLPFLAAIYLVFVAVVFFCELQPFLIDGMFDIADRGGFFSFFTGLIKTLAAIATPVAAFVAVFRQQLAAVLKNTSAESNLSTKFLAVFGKAAIWVAALALPLLIWLGYLYLCYWGIINDKAVPGSQGIHTPEWLLTGATIFSEHVAVWLGKCANSLVFKTLIARPMSLFYLASGLVLLVICWLLKPNANSLHRLYRDRLSKAFLFDPVKPADDPHVARNETSPDQKRDFPQLDTMRLSHIAPVFAPYHLINAALNIQGSDYVNRRGRNADFFLFSPLYVGSFATGYARTREMEASVPALDLATAMAISGAAVSSNMGAQSIRPLTPTLALLNIRLGYWLKNPRYVGSALRGLARVGEMLKTTLHVPGSFLWSEITGRLYESSSDVYLTDGGHIENLGLYELLRRRCRVIIAVDVEADSEMHFGAFVTLQRYARIDLGVRIEMPWDRVSATTVDLMKPRGGEKDSPPTKPAKGPHASIGIIDYGGGAKGFLVYLKSSVTGDENDYVRDYRRRYIEFPHETTGDQFFSEEQFEVYRALGFHVANGAIGGDDVIEVEGAANPVTFKDTKNATVKAVREALL